MIKLSYYNSDKEFYYKLFINFHKNTIEDVINYKLGDGELDKYYFGRKLDMFFITECGKVCIGEVSLKTLDDEHINQLIKAIDFEDGVDNLILFVISLSFKDESLNIIRKKINESNKNIHFFALKYNPDVIPILEDLNKRPLEVVDNLNKIKQVRNHLSIKESYYRVNQDKTIGNRVENLKIKYDLNRKNHALICLIEEIRRQVYYLTSVYRCKKTDKNSFVIGGGRSDINYSLGINRDNIMYVELRFTANTRDIFQRIVEDIDVLQDNFNFMLEVNTEFLKIGSYYYWGRKNKEQIINQVARMFHKYVTTFLKYTL